MSKCGVLLSVLAALLLMVGVIRAEEKKEEEIGDHYPKSWVDIDFKPIVDNDRLFKKYKDCLLSDKTTGCPRDVTQFKTRSPDQVFYVCQGIISNVQKKGSKSKPYINKKLRANFNYQDKTYILHELVPEIIENECVKCLPEHIAKFKEVVEYICLKRRSDYDEVRHTKDPNGEIQKKFEDKFGHVNC